jgi:hypothetical protein
MPGKPHRRVGKAASARAGDAGNVQHPPPLAILAASWSMNRVLSVIVLEVSLGQFTLSLGLTLGSHGVREILLPAEFHTLLCSGRAKQT